MVNLQTQVYHQELFECFSDLISFCLWAYSAVALILRNGWRFAKPDLLGARTEITTQLLSDKGYSIVAQAETEAEANEESETPEVKETFFSRDFERKFFSEPTNRIFCETFLKNALRDPISGEIGKTIIFCVSQNHAAEITQILNQYAEQIYPGKYQSDFAVQVTSLIHDAQQMTINFANNNLNGKGNFDPFYQTGKSRVCVTVGRMTTGYDCEDLLTVCLLRPIFSPTDFVQIKGRGTRLYDFVKDRKDKDRKAEIGALKKERFKLFEFFANCEYFEEKFDYDEVLQLPVEPSAGTERESGNGGETFTLEGFENFNPDPLKTLEETAIGAEGMKVDRKLFERFEDRVKTAAEIKRMVEQRDFAAVEEYIVGNVFDRPEEYYNLEKLRKTLKIDRRLSLREIIEKIFGFIPYFKNKNELLEEEFDKFDSRYTPDEQYFTAAKHFFKSYLTDASFREILESKHFGRFNYHPNGKVFFNLPLDLRNQITEYIKDNVSLNQFME